MDLDCHRGDDTDSVVVIVWWCVVMGGNVTQMCVCVCVCVCCYVFMTSVGGSARADVSSGALDMAGLSSRS